MVTKQQALESLAEVIDPELGANVVALGLVKAISIGEGEIRITLILTVPGCPLKGYMLSNVRKQVERISEGKMVNVELSDEP